MNRETEEGILTLVVILTFIIGAVIGISSDRIKEKKYGPETYEIYVTDKYDMIGSTWHLIGGRASESEFHIVYTYRCINRPDQKGTYREDRCVSYPTFKKYNVGQRYKVRNPYII